MTRIAVKDQGAKIGRRGERLVVSKDGQVVEEFPLRQVEELALYGNVQLTTQAMQTLLEQNIDVAFFSSYGKYRGRLQGLMNKNARLRQQQIARLGDKRLALLLGQAIVTAKIQNQRVVLLRQTQRLDSRRRPVGEPLDPALFQRSLAGMQQMLEAVPRARDLDALRGYEGKAAAYYFGAMRSLLDPDWNFARRAYYPPPDPFNALLSFGYSLLLKDVLAAVNLVGLDPYIGFFHEIDYGRPSLALDLMEEWRPVLADAMALELVNRGVLTPESFTWTGRLQRPVELGEESLSRVLREYGQRLQTRRHHDDAGGQTSVQQIIVLQTRRLARFVRGKATSYEPLTVA